MITCKCGCELINERYKCFTHNNKGMVYIGGNYKFILKKLERVKEQIKGENNDNNTI